jgi:hypothetical protein
MTKFRVDNLTFHLRNKRKRLADSVELRRRMLEVVKIEQMRRDRDALNGRLDDMHPGMREHHLQNIYGLDKKIASKSQELKNGALDYSLSQLR